MTEQTTDLYTTKSFGERISNSFKWFFQNWKIVGISLLYSFIMWLFMILLAMIFAWSFLIQFIWKSQMNKEQILELFGNPLNILFFVLFIFVIIVVWFLVWAASFLSSMKYIKDLKESKTIIFKDLIMFWFKNIWLYLSIMIHWIKYYIWYFLLLIVSFFFIIIPNVWPILFILGFIVAIIGLIIAAYKLIFSFIIAIMEEKWAEESIELSIKITDWQKRRIFGNLIGMWLLVGIISWIILSPFGNGEDPSATYNIINWILNSINTSLLMIFTYLLYLDCKKVYEQKNNLDFQK